MREQAMRDKDETLTGFAELLKAALMVLYATSAMTALMELFIFMHREGMGVAQPVMAWCVWWAALAAAGIHAVTLSRKAIRSTPGHAPFRSVLRRIWVQSLIWLVAFNGVRVALSLCPSSVHVVLYTLQIAVHITVLILAMAEWDRYQKINARCSRDE